jgi:hypothetical protein
VALAAPTGTAWADGGHGGHGGHDDQITTVATGLSGPRQMDQYRGNKLVVAESDSAEISSVNPYDGTVRTLFTLGSAGAVNPQGVGYSGGQLFIALGETGSPDEATPPPETVPPPTAPRCELTSALPPGAGLIVTNPDGTILARCDLLAAELFYNPDGQEHFAPGTTTPLDSVSNPFAVLVQDRRVLVADAGANTVWAVDRRTGEIKPFFALPVITGGVCDSTPNNTTPPSNSCDPTPTGVVQAPDGTLYVSGLSGLAQGEGRVYVLDQRGNVLRTIDQGLNPLTGIAVDRRGTVYASEIFGTVGADAFFGDPTQPAGRLVRIDGYGNRTYAPVVTPQGLEFVDGSLYAAALSLGPPPPAPPIGQVVRVGRDAFTPAP